jgi:hypothetical protein
MRDPACRSPIRAVAARSPGPREAGAVGIGTVTEPIRPADPDLLPDAELDQF